MSRSRGEDEPMMANGNAPAPAFAPRRGPADTEKTGNAYPRRPRPWLQVLVWLIAVTVGSLAPTAASGPAIAHADEPAARRHRPLAFEANRGQAPAEVKFLARGAGYTVFLTPSEAVLTLDRGESDRAVVRLMPVATRDGARIAGENPLPGVVTYTRGGSISAPTYASVRYA